jgi:hypothetical protein
MDDMLKWGVAANADPMDFVVVFEPELRMELAGFWTIRSTPLGKPKYRLQPAWLSASMPPSRQ